MIVAFLVEADENLRSERSRDASVTRDRFLVVEVGVADPINVGGGAPIVETERLVRTVRGRAVTAIRADKDRRVHFAAEILEVTRQRQDRARHVVRESVQEQIGL